MNSSQEDGVKSSTIAIEFNGINAEASYETAEDPTAPRRNSLQSKPNSKNRLKMTARKVITMKRKQFLTAGINLHKYTTEEQRYSEERKRLLSSISWLSYYVPACVILDLNKDIEKILMQEIDLDDDNKRVSEVNSVASDGTKNERETSPSNMLVENEFDSIQNLDITAPSYEKKDSHVQLNQESSQNEIKKKSRKRQNKLRKFFKQLRNAIFLRSQLTSSMNLDSNGKSTRSKSMKFALSILKRIKSTKNKSTFNTDIMTADDNDLEVQDALNLPISEGFHLKTSKEKTSLRRKSQKAMRKRLSFDIEESSRPTLIRTNRLQEIEIEENRIEHLSESIKRKKKFHTRKSLSSEGNSIRGINGSFKNRRVKSVAELKRESAIGLPMINSRESALLFIDISGFTKLSTLVDRETLSSGINSYFQMITDEIHAFSGDILKFAGDALFAEWKINDSDGAEDSNKSVESCVLSAARCGSDIVSKWSNFPIYDSISGNENEEPISTLNVHCGIGVGKIIGVHIGDHTSNREFIILGDPIDQVAKAEGLAALGELVASPEVLNILSKSHDLSKEIDEMHEGYKVIATSTATYFACKLEYESNQIRFQLSESQSTQHLHELCKDFDTKGLKELRKLISLYVHPVVIDDDEEEINSPTARKVEERIKAQAELRPIYVMFISPLIEAKLTGDSDHDNKIIDQLNDIFLVTIRELDRFNGHLRQFIVDDKGVVLIATFGLRKTNIQNMITSRALPATRVIHQSLLNELNVESRIGVTYGDVYCGVVGGYHRHEYAVLGPSVNLAARLMASPHNPGILVDEKVRLETGNQFIFNSLEPVKAKGYSELVKIFEPIGFDERQWKNVDPYFTGRKEELESIIKATKDVLLYDHVPKFFLISGDALSGKSSLLVQSFHHIRTVSSWCHRPSILLRYVNNEEYLKVPLHPFRSCFCDLLTGLHLETYENYRIFFGDGNKSAGNISDIFGFLCHTIGAPQDFISFIENNFLTFHEEYPYGAIPEWKKIVKFLVQIIMHCMEHENMIVIALDDVQNMDKFSWDLIQKLFEFGSNLLVICARKTLATSKLHMRENFWENLQSKHKTDFRYFPITLKPLEQSELRSLSSKYLDEIEVGNDLIDSVFELSTGVPGLALNAMDNIKKIIKEEGTRRGSIIREKLRSMSDVFIQQMDCLDLVIRDILQVCAVIGSEFSLLEVVTITEQRLRVIDNTARFEHAQSTHSSLDIAVQEQILEEAPEGAKTIHHLKHPYPNLNKIYRFRHNRWRESVLEMMLERRKLELQEMINKLRQE